jgi:hypothetical protein
MDFDKFNQRELSNVFSESLDYDSSTLIDLSWKKEVEIYIVRTYALSIFQQYWEKVEAALVIRGFFYLQIWLFWVHKNTPNHRICGLSLAYLRFFNANMHKTVPKVIFLCHTVLPGYSRFHYAR